MVRALGLGEMRLGLDAFFFVLEFVLGSVVERVVLLFGFFSYLDVGVWRLTLEFWDVLVNF